eukprot:gene4088-2936_t
MQREIIKWLQSLDLTYPVRNPRRDLANGFVVAEILSRYVDTRYICMASITNSISSTVRRSNWEQVMSALQRLGCRTITAEAVECVIQLNPNAALNVLEHLYEFLTKKPLAVRTIDAGGPREYLSSKDAGHVTALLECVDEILPNSLPSKVQASGDPDEEAIQQHFIITSLHNKLAVTRNTEVAGSLRPLRNPRYAHHTISSLVHNATHSRYNIVLGRDKYLPEDLEVSKRNEQIIFQHAKVKSILQESEKKSVNKIPLTTLLRGRYANSKIYEQKRGQKNRQARSSSRNLLQDADNTIGSRKLDVNVMSETLMHALENNGIYLSRDARAGEKSVEFFTACGFNIRKAFSSILKDVLAAHRELLALIERSGKNSEGDVLEDLFTAFVSHRDQIPIETLQACWTALEQNTAGIAAAVNAREEEYGYIIQTLSYVFTLEASQVPALHVSGAIEEDERKTPLRRPLGETGFKEKALEAGQPNRRLAVRMDRQAFHLASAFVLLSKIGEALQECNAFMAEVAVEHYFLPAALPSLISYSKAGMVDAVARVVVTSCMGNRMEDVDEEDETKRALASSRLEKLVTFMEYVIQPLVLNGGSSGDGDERFKSRALLTQNRQRYYLLLYHVMRQTAEAHLMTVELNMTSQSQVEENPLIRLASETAARCLSSEHAATRAMGVGTTLMLLLWDCWVPLSAMVKEFVLRPALEDENSGFLSSIAGEWEGRVLTLDLLCLLFKKIVMLLSEDYNNGSASDDSEQSVGRYAIEAFPLAHLDRATARYLRTFSHAPLHQRHLALSIVGQHLIPDCQPILAATWMRLVTHIPADRLQEVVVSDEDQPREMRMAQSEGTRRGPGISLINNNLTRPSSANGSASSSISLLLGQVEPTYSILPLNQTWDTYSVVHTVIRYLKQIDPVKALTIIAGALMSPQEEENQVTHLMRNFQFVSVTEWCAPAEVSLEESREPSPALIDGDGDCTLTLRDLVLTSTGRPVSPFADPREKRSGLHASQSSRSHYSEEDEEYNSEEGEEYNNTSSSHDKNPMDGFRVSKAFWYTVLQRLEPVITSLLPSLSNESKTYDELTQSEQLASAVLLTLYYRYVKGLNPQPQSMTVGDVKEAHEWLQQHPSPAGFASSRARARDTRFNAFGHNWYTLKQQSKPIQQYQKSSGELKIIRVLVQISDGYLSFSFFAVLENFLIAQFILNYYIIICSSAAESLMFGGGNTKCIFALAVVGQTTTIMASAQRSFECQMVWSGPSPDNEIMECIFNADRIKHQLGYFTLAIIAAILFLALLCVSPSSLTRLYEDEEHEERKSHEDILYENKVVRTKTLLLSITGVIALTCVLFLLVLGSIMVRSGVSSTLSAIKTGPLLYMIDVKDQIQNLLIDHVSGTSSPLNLSVFDEVQHDVSSSVDDINNQYMKYANLAVAVAIAMGIIGILCGITSIIASIFHCPVGFPFILGWVYYALALVYMLLAVVFGVLATLLSATCGEVVLQYDRKPGIMQWYLFPSVEDSIDFRTIRNSIDETIQKALHAFCSAVLDYCSMAHTPYFTCGGITSADECVSIDFVFDQVIPNIILLPPFSPYCPAPASVRLSLPDSQWMCSIKNCTTMCTLSPLKDAAVFITEKAEYVANASTALSYILPMINLDYIIDLVSSIVESPPTVRSASYSHPDEVHCSQIRGAAWMMASGFFIGSITFFVFLVILMFARNSWMESKLVHEDLQRERMSTEPEKSTPRSARRSPTSTPRNISDKPVYLYIKSLIVIYFFFFISMQDTLFFFAISSIIIPLIFLFLFIYFFAFTFWTEGHRGTITSSPFEATQRVGHQKDRVRRSATQRGPFSPHHLIVVSFVRRAKGEMLLNIASCDGRDARSIIDLLQFP